MAVTNIDERQYPLKAVVDLGIANIGAGNEVTVNLRPNTYVTNIKALVVTAFDGTTNTVTAGDGTATFISAEDAKATAGSAVTVDLGTKFYPSGGTITFSLAQTGAATVGRIMAEVEYVILNRSNEIQT